MRELSKSLFSLSWALPLFGLQQMANFNDPDRAASSMDAVTRSAADQMGSGVRSLFRSGDELGRGAVEASFALFDGRAFDPRRWGELASDLTRRASRAAGGDCCDDDGTPRSGWGPVKPGDGD